MKKRIIFILIALLLLPACSKSKDKKNNAATTGEKTVDLNEIDKNDDAAKRPHKNDDAAKRPHKNDAHPVMNMEGRGKPAAEIEFEEQQAKKAQKNIPAENAPNPDTPPNPTPEKDAQQPAEDNQADNAGFDFSDPPAPEIRQPKLRQALDIETLITIRELREYTGFSGPLSETWLPGQEADSRYKSARLATDNPAQLGFAIQVWTPGNESAAAKRFNDLFAQSFGGKKIKNIATDAFSASHHHISELAFFDKSKRSTVLISCTDTVCPADKLKNIAAAIQKRL